MPKNMQFNQHAIECLMITYLLEVGAGSSDLVYEVLSGENVVFSESGLNDSVVGKRDSLFVDLAISSLVDQLTN